MLKKKKKKRKRRKKKEKKKKKLKIKESETNSLCSSQKLRKDSNSDNIPTKYDR